MFIYSVEAYKHELIHSFGKADGIISHCMLGTSGKLGNGQIASDPSLRVFYVQNTRQIIMFEPSNQRKTTLVGTSPGSILALHVTRKGLRRADMARKKSDGVDLEQGDCFDEATEFIIAVVDEHEVISVFDTSVKSVKEPKPIA